MSEIQNITPGLIPVGEYCGKQVVSGRELHAFLQIGRDYTNWFKQMVEYGFTEGQDFTPITAESTGGRPRVDHALTLDMGKELGMIQRTELGRQIRQYFIEMEKRATAQPAELSTLQIIELAREAELGRIAAIERAVIAEARAESTQLILDNVNRGDGIVVREWLKKYFPPRQEQKLWALFYSKRLLKDGLGLGGTDRHGKPKPSRDHQAVLTDGQSFFIRTRKPDFVGDGVKRYETKVRPGRAELELVAYCERNNITPLPEVSQALFEINDLSTVFATEKGIAA